MSYLPPNTEPSVIIQKIPDSTASDRMGEGVGIGFAGGTVAAAIIFAIIYYTVSAQRRKKTSRDAPKTNAAPPRDISIA